MMRFIVNQSGDMAINFDNICVMSCAPQTNGYCIAVDLDYSSNDDLLVIGEYKSEQEAKAVFSRYFRHDVRLLSYAIGS